MKIKKAYIYKFNFLNIYIFLLSWDDLIWWFKLENLERIKQLSIIKLGFYLYNIIKISNIKQY